MKHILFIHQSSDLYGSDKVLLLLVEGLIAVGEYVPIVVLPGAGPLLNALVGLGIEVHIGEVAKISRKIFSPLGLLYFLYCLIVSVFSINRIVAGRKVVVVHSNTVAVWGGAFWSFIRRRTHLWHIHEIVESPKSLGVLFPWLINAFSNKVVANSVATKRWLISGSQSIREKCDVVFNGIPKSEIPSVEAIEGFRRRAGLRSTDLVVSLVGRVNKWKGQDLFINAINILLSKQDLTDVKFLIVGGVADGQDYLIDELRKKVDELGVGSHVIFVPFCDNVWPIWYATDVAVVPSIEPEPFGLVAIEAMAAGVPVVAANHGGLAEIVVDGETGFLVEPRDAVKLAEAMSALISDDCLRSRLGAGGVVRQVKYFGVDEYVNKFTHIYLELSGPSG